MIAPDADRLSAEDPAQTGCEADSVDPSPDTKAGGRAYLRLLFALLIFVGALVVLALFAHFSWRAVAASLATLGLGGFALYCGYTLAIFCLLGWSWYVIVPALPLRHLPAFIFGRLMREVASDILPFSQLGGFVVGARGATVLGAPLVSSVASSIVDLAAEIVGQLMFTAVGVVILAVDAPKGFPHKLLDPILAVGLAVGVITATLFIFSQRLGLGLLNRFSSSWPKAIRNSISSIQVALKDLYAHPMRVVASILLHFAAWIGAAGGVWWVLGWMGSPLSFPSVIAMESLIYLLRSAAFFVPGAVGVLEGGYVLLGPVFGLNAEVALSLSLIKRGRDLAIGLPAVLVWQVLEGRRLLGRRKSADGREERLKASAMVR